MLFYISPWACAGKESINQGKKASVTSELVQFTFPGLPRYPFINQPKWEDEQLNNNASSCLFLTFHAY